MPRRNRNVDVFGGILEASDTEIEAAGVRRNYDDDNHPVQNSSSSRSKPQKRVRFPAALDGAENTAGPSRQANDRKYEFPEHGSYIIEDKVPLMHEPEVHENSLHLPVRMLDDFFLFEPGATRPLVPITTLWEGAGVCEAFGKVSPYIAPEKIIEDYDYEGDKVAFKTTVILRFLPNVFRQEIVIQTEFALYILTTPAPFYREYYFPFYKKEMILRLVVKHICDDPDATEAEFFESIEDNEDPLLKKAWTPEDIVPEIKYTREELKQVLSETPSVSWEDVCDAPLLKIIITGPGDSPTRSRRALPRPLARAPEVFPRKKKTKVPPCWETTVTPVVNHLIAGHIETAIKVVGRWPPHLKKKLFLRERPPTPPTIENYTPVPGDFVLVKKAVDDGRDTSDSDSESDESGPEEEGDTNANHFGRIAQVISVHSRKSFHARWFVHGTDTILEEFAHGQELFLSVADGCEDLAPEMVLAKCKVVRISLRENSKQKWPDKNTYFYCAAWDRKNPAGFVEVTDKQVGINECYECVQNEEPLSEITPDGARVKNVEYHTHDFIRYKFKDGIVCGFGQINRFLRSHNDNEVLLEIFQIGRVKDRVSSEHFTDMELYITSSTKFVQAVDILGRVRILHTAQYERQCVNDPKWIFNNQFIFHMQSKASSLDARLSPLTEEELQTCDTCLEEASAQDFSQSICRGERVLKALDPYIGAAGFGAGLSEGCSMETVFGVDKNPSAAETARKNLSKDAQILTNDTCRILAKVVDGSVYPGEIDLIYSGPPCQNDSNLNRHKTDPIRPLFTTLSYVEFLRPDFLVLESVLGFLSRKMIKKIGKEEKEIEEKRAGELKLTLRILHFLGYNVSGGIMYALSYGVPQTRSRFFLVASHPSYGAFSFPEPTHGFKTSKGRKDPVGRLLPRPSKRHKLNDTLRLPVNLGLGTGLLETVTVAETLSDLPLFDWMVPKSDRPTRPQVQQVTVGPRKVIWGIHDTKFMYTRPCVNSYQYRLRFNIGTKLKPAYQHYTKHFVSDKVLNILDLPIVDGADYRHLQQQNLEWGLRDPASSKAIQGHRGHAYTRLIPSGYFDTIVTNVGPNAKQAKIIHPYCKRILTVREYARAQGFPDSFAFYSEDNKADDYLKQIGNSVPFAVSAAIGRAIQELVFQKWLKDNDD